MRDCPFCVRLARGEVTHSGASAAAFPDAYPVAPGHMLVVPYRHVSRLSDLTTHEYREVWDLADELRRMDRSAEGFNIGVNDGAAAGQTVSHLHIHVIPRRTGDTADPRGGIRWVIPDNAAYWADDASG